MQRPRILTHEELKALENRKSSADCLQRLVRPHVGKSSNRLHPDADNPREVAFAMEWSDMNDHKKRAPVLGHLLDGFSDCDAEVAATVIQWLGSNVGMSFLEDVINREPKIKEWLAARIVWPNEKS